MTKRDNERDDRINLEDPLGIADIPVEHDPKIHAADDEASRKRRRERALGPRVEERHSTGLGDLNIDPDGAAGTDMGYGGEGTDVKPSR
jgi:hypothetical protein